MLIPLLGAPAFRVTYARDLRGLDQAAAKTIIVPGYSALRGDRERRKPEIKLGHLNCSIDMFEWSGPIFVRVTALTADGHLREREAAL